MENCGLPFTRESDTIAPPRFMKYPTLLFLSFICLTGCSLDERLDKLTSRLEAQYAQTRQWEHLPKRTISWQQAIAMLKRQNAELTKQRSVINKAKREELSVYTDLIPGASLYSNFEKSLSGLTNTWSTDDLSTNINVTFNVPTLTHLPYRVYAAEANSFAAQKALEGKEQELISKLYVTIRKQEINQRKKALEQQKHTPEGMAMGTRLETEGSLAEQWKTMAQLLGDYSARWQILPESVPDFRWGNYRKRLNKLSPLVVCMLAMELEQARMQQYNIALSYLPTINTNLYSPSLFSTSGGTYQGTFLSMDDTTLNLSLSYRLDTRLTHWNRYQDSKEAYRLRQKEVAAKLMDHRQKLHLLQQSMDEYHTWRRYMQKRIAHLRESRPASAEAFLEQQNALLGMQRELLSQEEKALESEGAILLEYGFRP